MLSDEKIKKFQDLYKNRFNVELSKQEAFEKASKLVQIIEAIYKPTADYENKLQRNDDKHQANSGAGS